MMDDQIRDYYDLLKSTGFKLGLDPSQNSTRDNYPPAFQEKMPTNENNYPIQSCPSITDQVFVEIIDYAKVVGATEAYEIFYSGEINLILFELPRLLMPKQFLPADERAIDPHQLRSRTHTRCCYILGVPDDDEVLRRKKENLPCSVPFYRFSLNDNTGYTDCPLINNLAMSLTIAGRDVYCVEPMSTCSENSQEGKKKRIFSPSNPVKKHWIHRLPDPPLERTEALLAICQDIDNFISNEFAQQTKWANKKIAHEIKRNEIIKKIREEELVKIGMLEPLTNPCSEIKIPDFYYEYDIKEPDIEEIRKQAWNTEYENLRETSVYSAWMHSNLYRRTTATMNFNAGGYSFPIHIEGTFEETQ